MSNHQLLEIVKESFPEFRPESESDLIKAEKILKIHLKQNNSFSPSDIEEFIIFHKENGNDFSEVLADLQLQKIVAGEHVEINSALVNISNLESQKLYEFGENYEAVIWDFLRKNIQNNNWVNIQKFLKYYRSTISFNIENDLKDTVSEKNLLTISVLNDYTKYSLFRKDYIHSWNADFYALQSDLDVLFFEDEVFDINNLVATQQHTTKYNKVFLGKILMAIHAFRAEDEELKRLLEKNSKIGAKWAQNESKLDKLAEKSQVDTEKDYGAFAEWLMMSVFYAIVFGIGYAIYSWQPIILSAGLFLEVVVLLIANKQLNKHFAENSSSKSEKNFRWKMKKLSFKLFILQIYVVFALIILALIAIVVLITVASGGSGLFVGVIIYFIVRAIRKKG